MRIACAVWLVAAVWSSFPLFGWGEYVPEPYGLSCTIAWRGYHTSAKDAFYVICSFACFTLVPVVLIVVSQCRIIYKVSRFSDSLSARGIRNNLRYAEKRLSMVGEFKNKVVWPWNCFFFSSSSNDQQGATPSVAKASEIYWSLWEYFYLLFYLLPQYRVLWSRSVVSGRLQQRILQIMFPFSAI